MSGGELGESSGSNSFPATTFRLLGMSGGDGTESVGGNSEGRN